jgi:hypothetical protein
MIRMAKYVVQNRDCDALTAGQKTRASGSLGLLINVLVGSSPSFSKTRAARGRLDWQLHE